MGVGLFFVRPAASFRRRVGASGSRTSTGNFGAHDDMVRPLSGSDRRLGPCDAVAVDVVSYGLPVCTKTKKSTSTRKPFGSGLSHKYW